MCCGHSDNCGYKDEEAVLYALMEVIEGRKVLVSANEVSVFDDYLDAAANGDEGITIDFDTCDSEPYQLVYGALMYNGVEFDKVVGYVEGLKGYALIDLDGDKFGKIVASSYADICLFADRKSRGDSEIPFVALMQTKSYPAEGTSLTMFPCCDKCVWENMVNRAFLLACRTFVKKEGLTLHNWKEHIDMDVLDEAGWMAGVYAGPMDDECL